MRLKYILILACIGAIASCGNYRPGGVPAPKGGEGPDLGISENSATEIAGNYTVTLVTFDSDPSKDYDTYTTVTTVMRNVEGSTDGDPWLKQAALKNSSLRLNDDGTYELVYEFINASSQSVTMGNFGKGAQDGTFEMSGDTISFFPADDESPGFANALESTYTAWFDLGSLIINADAASPDGRYLLEVKGIK